MPTNYLNTTRRNLVKALAAAGVGTALGPGLVGRAFSADVVVGVIYVGPKDDYG